MDHRLIIYILCMAGGFILLVGGLWLASKKKILVDVDTRAVIDMEIPWLGKLKTNIPGIVFFVLGFGLVAYPVYRIDQISPIFHVEGRAIAGNSQIQVYVALKPEIVEKEKRDFFMRVPVSNHVGHYEVLYISNDQVVSHRVIKSVLPGETVEIPPPIFGLPEKKGIADQLGIR